MKSLIKNLLTQRRVYGMVSRYVREGDTQLNCNRCGAPLQPEDTFCPECGIKVKGVFLCEYCGGPLEPDDEFCPGCGKAVPKRKPKPKVSEKPKPPPPVEKPPPEKEKVETTEKGTEKTQYIPPQIRYAGFWSRFFALVLDLIFVPLIFSPLIIGSMVVAYFLGNLYSNIIDTDYIYQFTGGIGLITYSIIFFFYYLIGHSFGSTIGKKIMGIRLVTFNGSRPGFWRALVRETIGRFIASIIFYLGYLWIAWDSHKQGWHDKIVGTFCIRTR
jgi:uncharacterized RDD family membrane protein YckC/RNA polymerase subunit RPABC4/transcription elongation factor Spt4